VIIVYLYCDTARVSEFNCILHQIDKNLPQSLRIKVYIGWHSLIYLATKFEIFLFARLTEYVNKCLRYFLANIRWFDCLLEAVGLYGKEIQHVANLVPQHLR
jgi:hypothetical protein